MYEKKCPACGVLVQAGVEICPACGLEGLNRRFLSRAGYERWVQEALEPHRAALAPKVFAGEGYGLVLTPDGDLYGIGKNHSGQIEENGRDYYSYPHPMAKNVISAAAGEHYAVYVTRDGETHLRGRGELAERFPGFSGARKVSAESHCDWYWICDEAGQVFCFGDNQFSLLQEGKNTVWKTLDEVRVVIHYFTQETWGPDKYSQRWVAHRTQYKDDWVLDPICRRIEEGNAYRNALLLFGGENVYLTLKKTGEEPAVKKRSDSDYARTHIYQPEIHVTNRVIYKPVLCPDSCWPEQTRCWNGSRPVAQQDVENAPQNWKGVRKLCVSPWHGGEPLFLLEDGSIEPELGKPRLRFDSGVCDVSWCRRFLILVCKNGEIIWCEAEPMKGTALERLVEGKQKACHLSQKV